ncbi:MAG: STAS domain-containing protein [Clostridiales bacterium]|nr:MAG: STAS domain-containing protein [Clostridiales bacterium]
MKNSSGSLMIRLIGDVDDNGIIKARQDIDRLLEKERYYEVVFDFSGVSFMDSTGIGMLLGRYKKLEKLSVPMYVTGTNKQVDKVFFYKRNIRNNLQTRIKERIWKNYLEMKFF